MSLHAEWDEAATAPVSLAEPGDEGPDGQTVEGWGLVLGGDGGGGLVVYGTPRDLLDFADRVDQVVTQLPGAGLRRDRPGARAPIHLTLKGWWATDRQPTPPPTQEGSPT
jgi:hypothetical protein